MHTADVYSRHNSPLKGPSSPFHLFMLTSLPLSLSLSSLRPLAPSNREQICRLPARLLARLYRPDRPGREGQTACRMMNDELISEKQPDMFASPARLTAGRCYISQPALSCTYLLAAVFLAPRSFPSLSFFFFLLNSPGCASAAIIVPCLHCTVCVYQCSVHAERGSRSYQLTEATSLTKNSPGRHEPLL